MQSVITKEVGIKYDSEKPDYSLLAPDALEELVKVLTYGANKYSRDNWKQLTDANNRYFAASMRHMWALRRGEELDPESGLSHIAHAMASMMFLFELNKV